MHILSGSGHGRYSCPPTRKGCTVRSLAGCNAINPSHLQKGLEEVQSLSRGEKKKVWGVAVLRVRGNSPASCRSLGRIWNRSVVGSIPAREAYRMWENGFAGQWSSGALMRPHFLTTWVFLHILNPLLRRSKPAAGIWLARLDHVSIYSFVFFFFFLDFSILRCLCGQRDKEQNGNALVREMSWRFSRPMPGTT